MSIGPTPYRFDPGLAQSMLRYPLVVVLAAVLGGACGSALAGQEEPRYDAYATVLLADPSKAAVFQDSGVLWHFQSRFLRNQVRYILSQHVVEAALERLESRYTPADLAGHIGADSLSGRDVIVVRGSHPDPQEAAAVANALARAYSDAFTAQLQQHAVEAHEEIDRVRAISETEAAVRDERSTGDRIATAKRLLALSQRDSELTINEVLHGSPIVGIEEARVPRVPAHPRPVRSLLAGALLGSMGGIAAAWLIAWHRLDVREPQDARDRLAAPMLAHLAGTPPGSSNQDSDALGLLALIVAQRMAMMNARAVAVVSGHPGLSVTEVVQELVAALRRCGVPTVRHGEVDHAAHSLVVKEVQPLSVGAGTALGAVDAVLLIVRRGGRVRDLVQTRQRLDVMGTPLLGYVLLGGKPQERESGLLRTVTR